jgi:hypothetical protein
LSQARWRRMRSSMVITVQDLWKRRSYVRNGGNGKTQRLWADAELRFVSRR